MCVCWDIRPAGSSCIAISTDSHHPKHLLNMRYGVKMARRGWLEAADVLNTLPVAQFAKAINAK
jgi:DNA polymerase (family 10)